MLYKLVSTEGEQAFELKTGVTLVVGRALNSDIPVFDPTISRRHAEVTCDTAGISVKDLGSSNGTFLNGAKIESTKVAPGDVVTFGKVAFRLKEMAPTPMEVPMSAPAAKPGATIVRQVPLRDSKGMLGGGTIAAALGLDDKRAPTPNDNPVIDRNAQKLQTLLEVSKGLSRAIAIDQMLEEIVKYCFLVFDVDRVSILLGDEKSDLVPKISHNKKGKITGGASVPQSIARKAVEEKSVILS
ncbi:MAG: FHA domain-containing protein, partial [Gemmatimonadaceae bacterium]